MSKVDLHADCSRCAALCCVALAFDRSALFAIDKDAGEPCSNLDGCGGCTIHLDRVVQGFRGCVEFDCQGAGQRVTQEVFGGKSWMADMSLLEPMSRAFSTLLRAHEYLLLLRQAESLDLSSADRARLDELWTAVEDAGASAEKVGAVKVEVYRFLSGLQSYVGVLAAVS